MPDAEAVFTLEEFLKAGWGTLTVGRVLTSLALLLGCLMIVRLLMKLCGKLLERPGMDGRVRHYALRGVRTALYLVAGLVFAGSLGIDVSSLIALASVLGLAVSLAVQEILSNVAAGIELLLAKPFALGDYISAGDAEGEVAEITLTHTKLDTPGGQRVMLPNSKLAAGQIINYSVRGMRRADHAVAASYDDDPDKVRRACLEALERTPGVLAEPAPQVVLSGYGESAIEYRVRFWAATADYWDAHFRSLEEIRKAFIRNGVSMTYNHLNVHIVDGIQQ